MDYTAVGQTTHLAACMEQLAAPGSIRLSAQTLHLAEGFVQRRRDRLARVVLASAGTGARGSSVAMTPPRWVA